MKIAVDVRKVVQEIDLDTGNTNNYLVFVIGGFEHVVPATEEQLQQAVYEARVHQKANGHVVTTDEVTVTPGEVDLARREGRLHYTPQAPTLGAVGEIPDNGTFVGQMLEDDVDDAEVSQAIMGGAADPSIFDDVSAVATEEDLREYQIQGSSTMPGLDVVSDEEGPGASFEEIMQHYPTTREDAPLSPQRQRQANIAANRPHAEPKGEKALIAALRARARKVPPRSLQPHQVDEAGNPVVPQKSSEAAPGFARYTDPNAPTVQVAPVPPGLSSLADEDGFEQG